MAPSFRPFAPYRARLAIPTVLWMTPYNRVVLVIGGAAVLASISVAAIFMQTTASATQLETDEASAFSVQTLGDQMLTDVQDQHEALNDYLLSADPRALTRYQLAVTSEAQTADRILAGGGGLAGVATALAAVDAENDTWRANIADPAIAAVQTGSSADVQAAIQKDIQDHETNQGSTAHQFRLQIDTAIADLGLRSDQLNAARVGVTVGAVAIELAAAGLSLWFVRRFGRRVADDARRRSDAAAERMQIVGSLRSLRMQDTAEATANMIAEALHRLPGIDVAVVFEGAENGLDALAVVGLADFPLRTGDAVATARAGFLWERSRGGPWAETWIEPAEPTAYDQQLTRLGIKSRAFAPIRADGELIGLIGLGTTDREHGRHMVEDLPAIGEFASVAETILAPALVQRRDLEGKRRRIRAMIMSRAFHPVFQPVVDLATGDTVGFEALSRFDDGARPDVVFAAAQECDLGIALETATLELALGEARHLPSSAWLSLNVSPALLAQEGTLGRMLAGRSRSIVLEITEHDAIDAYAPLRAAMKRLGPDVRLAVDDVGAGVANFNHLVELRPDFIKIDVGLVRGVDIDPSRRAVVVGLVHFAAEAGCQVLAEGIETEGERSTVTDLGVTLGQGYLLARPGAAETWRTAVTLGTAGTRTARAAKAKTPVRRAPLPASAGMIH